ncbi:MAG: hypothetical protein AB1410_02645 [Acidobacteriota bacterium]
MRVKFFQLAFLILIFLIFGNCVRARVATYPGFKYTPTLPEEVNVYYFPPQMPFIIIGEVVAEGAPAASWGRVENIMKQKVASIGGDAIILIERRETFAGTYTTPSSGNAFVYGNQIYYTYQPGTTMAMRRKHVIGLVIKWKG